MSWKILIGKYRLTLLDECVITESVDALSDTANIKLPGSALNKMLEIESKVHRGDVVRIMAGYDGEFTNEFSGFVQSIFTDDDLITISCEDGIYLTRKPVKDKQFVSCTIGQIAQYVIDQVNLSLTKEEKLSLSCDYTMKYDKFIISKANGRDVLSKLQEESHGNIYMQGRVLHIHPAYIQKSGDVTYDFAKNIEKSDLKYRREDERQFEVEVEGIGLDGKRQVVILGTTGGEKRSIKISGVTDKETLKKRGLEELKYLVYTGYEGSITAWGVPECHPAYSAKIVDVDYPTKTGTYYVVTVTTTISRDGIAKKVELGRKLA